MQNNVHLNVIGCYINAVCKTKLSTKVNYHQSNVDYLFYLKNILTLSSFQGLIKNGSKHVSGFQDMQLKNNIT